MTPLHFDYPKEVGLFRKVVHSEAEFEKYWRALENSQCAYMSVYGFRALQPSGRRGHYITAIVKNFVLDFDKKYRKGSDMVDVEGDEVVAQVRRLHQFLLDEDVNHAVWFSGNGFHIWVSLDKPYLPTSGHHASHIRAAGKSVINEWKKDMELYCMDPTVPFDNARMIRVPNSYNAKQHVLRWSIPLKTEELMSMSWDDICEMAENPRNTAFIYGTKGVHLDVKDMRKRNFRASGDPVEFDTVKMGSIKILPCLMEAACQVGSNPPHIGRASLAIYLASRLRNFLPVERTTVEMREKHILTLSEFIKTLQWADYDPGITEYQVRSIVERGYTERCESLIGKGLCVGRCQLWDGTGVHDDEEVVEEEKVNLLQSEVDDCYEQAKQEVARHETRVGEYGHNNVASTFIGLKAERGVRFALEKEFTVDEGEGDLSINGRRIEVKTVCEDDWHSLGRMIPPKQLTSYVASSSIIVWATSPSKQKMDTEVIIKGWNHALDVQSNGEPIKTVCDNIWLKNESDVRPLSDLFSLLRKQRGA